VTFASSASNLVGGDTNGRYDCFVHDRQSGTTTCVSVHTNGSLGDGDTRIPTISPDGRVVAFASLSTNLVPMDTNGCSDVFVHGVVVAPPQFAFCFGDGTGTACPCGAGAAGNGCPSSVNTAGARLAASGTAQILADTLVLLGSGMPDSFALYVQGTSQLAGGAGVVFGDGLRCVGGSIIRLGAQSNTSGASHYPAVGDLPVSVRGQVTVPGVRTYQVWYRNAASFCTPATFNLTNGYEVDWIL
jgi:hypothetical protein